ncbi:MAG TPA: chemotaxis protein CheA [Paucimonas sp.]|nr:chemotaxis protein CheA [Paucimonas sp.]
MNLDEALQTFIAESRELLEDMESALLAAEHAESRAELVNAIFRAAHTIKGSAGLFGLDHIVAFTHVVESVLDEVRDARIQVTGQLVALLLSCRDHISRLIDMVAAGQLEADDAVSEAAAPLVRQLREALGAMPEADLQLADGPEETHAGAFERIEGSGGSGGASDYWHISLRFGPDVLRSGMDPMSFIRYLGTIGRIVGIATLADAMPADETMDPERCYLGFEIAFDSEADKATIENVFEFVHDDCRLCILPPHSRISEYVKLIHELPEEVPRLGEILVRCGSVTAGELEHALKEQAETKPQQRLGEILVEQCAVPGVVVDAALAKQQHASDQFRAQEARSIRVDADKLDHLINLIGELIIASASANLVARRARNDELQEAASILSGLVEEVRDSALELRMVKIGATFNRFQRVVHDVSREIGKDIRLVVSGEETELDKTVIEKIADPLTHLVRNAIDHGIEPAELRAARGKPAQGTVRLNAYHDSGCIVIEVGDDGGGLKRDKILAKAIERGLVEPGRNLSDAEICNLIFEPGFSTADKVTNLSGRGVGMDVVKRNITALRGSVDVQSEEGAGSKVIVRLPLTLAIINGFLVGLGRSTFVIPQDMIEECIEFSCEPGHDYTNLRGEVLPFIRLRELFGAGGTAGRRESIVVINYAGKKAGLVVDTLLGEFQTVIKPLGKMFGNLKCISGSTILGNGEVALILDVPMLVQEVANRDTQAA